eukprot:837918_1
MNVSDSATSVTHQSRSPVCENTFDVAQLVLVRSYVGISALEIMHVTGLVRHVASHVQINACTVTDVHTSVVTSVLHVLSLAPGNVSTSAARNAVGNHATAH